jgi:hypothetical protein
MRNNKRMICIISRKLKRSEQLHFGSKIAACGNLRYETDIVAVAYCAPKPVWEEWMNITCFASYSEALRLLFIVGHTYRFFSLSDTHTAKAMSSFATASSSSPKWTLNYMNLFTYLHFYMFCRQLTANQFNANRQNCYLMNLTMYRLKCLQRDLYDV